MELLIVGTVAFDKIETPFSNSEIILGGAATYAALAASFSNIKTSVLSVVGDDFPDEYLEILEGKGVDTSGVERVAGKKTFFWHGKYHEDMNSRDTIKTELNVLESFNPKVPSNLKNPDILMLANLHPSIQNSVLEQMDKRPSLVVLDTMNFWIEEAKPELEAIINKVDVLTINEQEARLYTGEYSLVKAAEKFMKLGLKYLIIKKGEHGALLFYNNEIFFAPAMPLSDIFDPTGAGDSFAGGFCAYLAENQQFNYSNLKRAVIYGSAMASFTVEKFGVDRLVSLNGEDLENRLIAFQRLTQYEFERL